jgi:hypothetical protein
VLGAPPPLPEVVDVVGLLVVVVVEPVVVVVVVEPVVVVVVGSVVVVVVVGSVVVVVVVPPEAGRRAIVAASGALPDTGGAHVFAASFPA